MMLTATAKQSKREKASNRLSYWMTKRRMSAGMLAEHMKDGNSADVREFELGRALPTRRDLKAIVQALSVTPIDIWNRDELDLLGLLKGEHEIKDAHEGQQQFRVWLLTDEKDKLEKAIKALGYDTPTAWFRHMAAVTLNKAEREGA